jgi:acylphosphatase
MSRGLNWRKEFTTLRRRQTTELLLGTSVKDYERREVWFTGRVQGVGFRYTTHRLAAGFQVTGFVKNLHDGRVRLVAEGSRSEIDGLVAAVKQQMAGKISDTEQKQSEYLGEFETFQIQH